MSLVTEPLVADLMKMRKAALDGTHMDIPKWAAVTPVGACIQRAIMHPDMMLCEIMKAIALTEAESVMAAERSGR